MTVIDSRTDTDALTLTFVTEFNAPIERVWQLWEDPRQLERWWGPPSWPATFSTHEFAEGGRSRYFMTGPNGETSHGWWQITAIEPQRRIEFDDGFADETGEPTGDLGPTHGVVTFEPTGWGTRMTMVSQFESLEQFEQMSEMGMEEGMREALEQIDAQLPGARA